MNGDLTVYEDHSNDIQVYRAPETVLAEATSAAKALGSVLAAKKKKVMMNGEQYLEFEDWQTVGRFYGVTAKVTCTEFLDLGGVQGFIAKSSAIRADGMEISAAEAMCMNDEPNWKSKPLFQLRSMAQTRACAKALRNVLAWVVVLAGYRPTPAEELDNMTHAEPNGKAPLKEPQKKQAKPTTEPQTATVNVKAVESKNGVKNDKPYTVYTVIDNQDTKYATFSDTLADLASSAREMGSMVTITYTVGQYGNKITDLVMVED